MLISGVPSAHASLPHTTPKAGGRQSGQNAHINNLPGISVSISGGRLPSKIFLFFGFEPPISHVQWTKCPFLYHQHVDQMGKTVWECESMFHKFESFISLYLFWTWRNNKGCVKIFIDMICMHFMYSNWEKECLFLLLFTPKNSCVHKHIHVPPLFFWKLRCSALEPTPNRSHDWIFFIKYSTSNMSRINCSMK